MGIQCREAAQNVQDLRCVRLGDRCFYGFENGGTQRVQVCLPFSVELKLVQEPGSINGCK